VQLIAQTAIWGVSNLLILSSLAANRCSLAATAVSYAQKFALLTVPIAREFAFHCRTACPAVGGIISRKFLRPIPFCGQIAAFKGICLFFFASEDLAKDLLFVKMHSRWLQKSVRFPRFI
jgi:hypothetical protein